MWKRELVYWEFHTFLKVMDLAQSYCPWSVLIGLFNLSSYTVGWSFLLAGFFPPDIDGLASAAIWANCWVRHHSGNLSTSSSLSTSSTLSSNSLQVGSMLCAGGVSLSGTGRSTSTGGHLALAWMWACIFIFLAPLVLPFLGMTFWGTVNVHRWCVQLLALENCLPLTNNDWNIQIFLQNPKQHLATLKPVRFTCTLPCGHPGLEDVAHHL